MERNVLWFADDDGYTVVVRHGIRVVDRFRWETLLDELPTERRLQAAARAVEAALEHRIELRFVSEARERFDRIPRQGQRRKRL